MQRARQYRVAGRLLTAGPAIDDLDPFEVARPTPAKRLAPPPPGRGSRLVFRGSGWVADGDRGVECRRDDAAYRLSIDGVGDLWVAGDGKSLGCSRPVPGTEPRLVQLALLGPALTLALALRGTFCLHASGVHASAGVLAFAGESGAGKSTLARRLATAPGPGYRQASDDILPLTADPLTARLDFPQLKLSTAEQPWLEGPASLPLRAVFLLRPPPKPRQEVRIDRLGATEATLALVRHTVASRLFDARLLDRHLRFCAAIAERVPVARLTYPWEAEIPPSLAEAIADFSA